MKENHSGKLKILLVFSVLFLAIVILLALIFFEGKKTYTVRFELDGGTLLSGSLEQRITQGQDAVPPKVVKDGAYLHGWSTSYKRITKDVVIEAVWEYETTPGIIYTDSENQNFTEILGSYPNLRGEIYLGAYHDEKKVLGIRDQAFANQTEITKFYLLDGLLAIGNEAFWGCTSLTEIEIPETVLYLGFGAFRGCDALETLTLNEGLLRIESYAFADCTALTEVVLPDGLTTLSAGAFAGCTALTEVFLPDTVTIIEADVFAGCENLVIKTTLPQEEWPEGWVEGWFGNATVEIVEPEEDEEAEDGDKTPDEDETTKEDKENKTDGRN